MTVPAAATLTLLHLTTAEEREVAVINFYPPAHLVLKWGDLSGHFIVDLRKTGGIQGISSWRIKDMATAQGLYLTLSGAKQRVTDRPIRPDDLAALQHWRKKGILE